MLTKNPLSLQYWELLGYLADGLSNSEIADLMQVKLRTVENYIGDIYCLLELDQNVVNARVQAAKWYWNRHNVLKNQIIKVENLPLILEVGRDLPRTFG